MKTTIKFIFKVFLVIFVCLNTSLTVFSATNQLNFNLEIPNQVEYDKKFTAYINLNTNSQSLGGALININFESDILELKGIEIATKYKGTTLDFHEENGNLKIVILSDSGINNSTLENVVEISFTPISLVNQTNILIDIEQAGIITEEFINTSNALNYTIEIKDEVSSSTTYSNGVAVENTDNLEEPPSVGENNLPTNNNELETTTNGELNILNINDLNHDDDITMFIVGFSVATIIAICLILILRKKDKNNEE